MNEVEKQEDEKISNETKQLKHDLFKHKISIVEFRQLSKQWKIYYVVVKIFILMMMIAFFVAGMYLGKFLLASILTGTWHITIILSCLVIPAFYISIQCVKALTEKKPLN